MEKVLCVLRLTPTSFPDAIEVEVRPLEFPNKPWLPGKARPWSELKGQLAEKGHQTLDVAEVELSQGIPFITDARFHYYRGEL